MNVPVLVNGYAGQIKPSFRFEYADPFLLQEVLEKFPKLKVVIYHMGWPNHENAIVMATLYDNVYLETSMICHTEGDLDRRIIPAEDFQEILRKAVRVAVRQSDVRLRLDQVLGRSNQNRRGSRTQPRR